MEQQKDIMKGLKPERVWHWFGEIMQIPRPSKHEERISAWLLFSARFCLKKVILLKIR